MPWEVEPFPAPQVPAGGEPTEARVALGRLLFYDPVVSVDRETACASCHSEFWGMADGLPVSIGHGAGLLTGPGRRGEQRTRRNATSLWNVAYRETLFWDGRARSLEDQVRFPFEAKEEFARPLAEVVAEVAGIAEYVRLFAAAFPGEDPPVTGGTFAQALAAFQRTLVSRRAPYDAYVADDPLALGETSLRGMELFAEVGCPDCHTPPLFERAGFADRGVPPVGGVDDLGRFEATGDEADLRAFQIPSLRNLQDTGPYFHTGAVTSLDEAVRHEVDRSAATLGTRTLDEAELADLVTFLKKALFDTSLHPSRPKEVPSGLPVPIDGFALRR